MSDNDGLQYNESSPVLSETYDLEAAMASEQPLKQPAMRKLSRAMMPAWKVRQLKIEQGGMCAICGKEIDLSLPREGVVDHDHTTGEIRGVLHRSCNSAEGKIKNVAGSWGAKDMSPAAVRDYLRRLLAYYDKPGCGLIYPTHVDAATAKRKSADKRNAAARERRAQQKAARAMRDQGRARNVE